MKQKLEKLLHSEHPQHENRHTVFLKVTNLDDQTQYQTVYEGDNLYGRKLYNGSGQWHKYTNTPI